MREDIKENEVLIATNEVEVTVEATSDPKEDSILSNKLIQNKNINLDLPLDWNVSNDALSLVSIVSKSLKKNRTTNVVATIPIICRGENCPYVETCAMANMGVDLNKLIDQRCPVEISKIMNKFDVYCDHFDLDPNDLDEVIMGLVKELIDYDIQIDRINNIIAQEATFMEYQVVGVDSSGRPIKSREISKPNEMKDKAIEKRHKIYQLLNSTPKDKAGNKLQITMDPSTYASNLLARAKDLQLESAIDIIDIDLGEVVWDEETQTTIRK